MASPELIEAVRADPVNAIMRLRDEGVFTDDQALEALRGLEDRGLVRSRGLAERIVSRIDDAVRLIANGMTLGAADAIAAGANRFTGLGEGDFGQNLAAEEARTDEARATSPTAGVMADVVGGIAGAAGVGKLAPALVASTNFVQRGIPLATRAVRAGTAATVGTGAGAVSGFFNTRGDIGQRAVGALGGGAVGLGTALALPVGLALIRAGGAKVAGTISKALTGPQSEAMRQILQAFERDAITFDQMAARLRTLGSRAFMVDAGAENVAGLLRAAASEPGPGRRLTERLLNARQTGQSGPFTGGMRPGQSATIANRLNEITGRTSPATQTISQVRTLRAAKAEKLYGDAFANAEGLIVDTGPILDSIAAELAKLPEDGARAAALRNVLGFMTRKTEINGETVAVPVTGLELLHNVKREIDVLIETRRVGERSIDSTIVRDLTRLKRDLVAAMTEVSPAYREALETFAGDSAYIAALESGTRLFARGADAVSADDLRGLSDSELFAFRMGAADAIIDRLASQRDVADATRSIFGSPALRELMTVAFAGDERAFREFQKVVLQEARFAATRNASLPSIGSRTSVLDAERADLQRSIAGPILQAAAGDLSGAAINAARSFAGTMKVSDPRVREEIARTLLSQTPSEIQSTLDGMALQRLLRDVSAGLDSGAVTAGVASAAARPETGTESVTVNDLLSNFPLTDEMATQ